MKKFTIKHDDWTIETENGFSIICEHCGREEDIINKRLRVNGKQMIWRCNDCSNERIIFTVVGQNEAHGIGIWKMQTPSGKEIQGMIAMEDLQR